MRYTTIMLLALALAFLIREYQQPPEPEYHYSARYDVLPHGDLVLKYVAGEERYLSDIQRGKPLHQAIWQRFVALVPAKERQHIDCYIAMTDGNKGLSAYVLASRDQGNWCLAVDISEMAPGDKIRDLRLKRTLVHEAAHVLMVSPDQYGFDDYGPQCVATHTLTGCPRNTAYFAYFWQRFWQSKPELGEPVPSIDPKARQAGAERYRHHSSEFVSEYAATNAVEDFAESWMRFVFNDVSAENKGLLSRRSHPKVLFFSEFPRLVEMRKRFRQRLQLD